MSAKGFLQHIFGYIVVAIFIFIIVFAFLYFNNKKGTGAYINEIKEGVLYHVQKVLDGDTVVANISGHYVTIRLIGIDTPEIVDPRKPIECYAEQASLEAKRILSDKEIYLEKEKGKDYDKYGRVLAYIRLPNGIFYNQYMIEKGFAREYTFNKERYKYQKEFKQDEAKAKSENIGLWKVCDA